MNQQKYPRSIIKKGAVLYEAYYYISDYNKAKVEVAEFIVRSIQKKRNSSLHDRFVNLARKLDGVTWGKRSRTNGDFGWLPAIPSWCLKQFREGNDLPFGLYTTKLAALKFAKLSLSESIKDYKNDLKDAKDNQDFSEISKEIDEYQSLLKVSEMMYKREKNKNKKTNS